MHGRTRPAVAQWQVLVLLLGIPFAAFFLLPMPRAHDFESKHLILLQPFAVLAAAGLAAGGRLRITRWVLLGGLVLVNVFGLCRYFRRDFEKERWRELVAELSAEEKAGDVIVFDPGYVIHAFDWYYRGGRARWGVPENPHAFRRQMASLPRGSIKRVWLVQCENPVSRPSRAPRQWLEANWRRQEMAVLRGGLGGESGGLLWAVYGRPSPTKR